MPEIRDYGAGRDLRNAGLLALACLAFIALRWKKMDSLLWGDPAHWLNEISRFARGDLPYRDFSYQYPPFAIFFYGWLLRWFGASFTAVQLITDIIGLGVVACCYAWIRRLLPRSLHLPVGFLVASVCSTSLMNFNLFSYVTYSPSLQTGALGVLLLLLALAGYIREGIWHWRRWMLAALGGFIALLSKPESALAAVAAVAVFALIVLKPRVIAITTMVVFMPALLAYVRLGYSTGFHNLAAGISGYGLATAFCPWWPTGLGTFAIAAAIGEASALAALFSLPSRQNFERTFGASYRRLVWYAPLGALVFAGFVFYQNRGALADRSLDIAGRLGHVIPYLIYTNPVLQPVVWVSIAAFAALAWRLFRTRLTGLDRELLLFVSAPVVMSTRALFSSTQNVYPEVAGICYPFLLVLGPYFLWRFLRVGGESYARATVMVLAVGYAVVRIAGGWQELLSSRHYETLQTPAGSVSLLNFDIDSKVYDYVMSNTTPSDYLQELPYGGGLNFATGRRSPIFNTQLAGLGIPPDYEQLDLDLIRKNPPRMVVAIDQPNLGTYWGYGIKGNRACPCPRLVWVPEGRSWDPDHTLAIARYVEAHYRVDARIGDKVIWVPR